MLLRYHTGVALAAGVGGGGAHRPCPLAKAPCAPNATTRWGAACSLDGVSAAPTRRFLILYAPPYQGQGLSAGKAGVLPTWERKAARETPRALGVFGAIRSQPGWLSAGAESEPSH